VDADVKSLLQQDDLVPSDVEEGAIVRPPKNTVEQGDIFLDLTTNYQVVADTISDSSGWRYLQILSPLDMQALVNELSALDASATIWVPTINPYGTVPDSDLLDPRLFRFLYHTRHSP
jgi:hypothetical protein